jgi:hypothetical protein
MICVALCKFEVMEVIQTGVRDKNENDMVVVFMVSYFFSES